MANRRMFTKKVTDDDNFMALSSSAQALYLHLSMSADDDGFSNQVSISMFKAHASIQDLQALLEKRYIYQFENGVIVIKHWRMANALRKDRYSPTAFQEELAQLGVKENGAYTRLPDGCQTGAKRVPQVRLGKDSIGKDSIGKVRVGNTPTITMIDTYIKSKGYKIDPHRFFEYYTTDGRTFPTNWQSVVDKWQETEYTKKPKSKKPKCMERDEICIDGFGTEYLRELSKS